MKSYIALAGNIGSGKTNLSKVLAQRLNWQLCLEPVEENPYLVDFYQDMKYWSFHSQIFYLTKSLQYNQNLKNCTGSIIQDRSIYENAEIFAKNLFQEKILSQRDWQTYNDYYQAIKQTVIVPDLLVYLQAPVDMLMQRIAKRNRDAEQAIERQYVEKLNNLYENWIKNFTYCPVLTVNIENTDFRDRPEEQDELIAKIKENLISKV